MREALRRLVHTLHGLLPKGRYAVLWGWPDYEDSVVALEAALQSTDIRRVVLLMTDRRAPAPVALGPKTVRLAKSSPLGVLAFLFARYVFFTHRCYTIRFPPNVVSVNIWHGMPLKRIGALLEGDTPISARFTLATSAIWASVMVEAMPPTDRVLITGLPRNDRLFGDGRRARASLGLEERPDVEQLAVWLPTYRRSVRGGITVDGRPGGSVLEMDDVDLEELAALAATLGTYVVVKPHPLAASAGHRTWSNLRVIDDEWLRESRITLYELLSASDLLISDLSSVVIDYVLLDRPVLHAIADLEAYRSSRGFTVEPVEEWFAGPVVTGWDGLRRELSALAGGIDAGAEQRRRLLERSHARDVDPAGATRRLLAAIGIR
jgi:CDP-glycerol glycerophosphotransferase (TagB/SpsB family)